MNVKEVASYTKLSVGTVYNLVSQKKIPFQRISEKKVSFEKDEIDRWLAERHQGSGENEIINPHDIPQIMEILPETSKDGDAITQTVADDKKDRPAGIQEIILAGRSAGARWLKPALATGLLLAVFFVGWIGSRHFYGVNPSVRPGSASGMIQDVSYRDVESLLANAEISDLQITQAAPDSEEVRIKLDESRKIEMKGEAGSRSIMPFLLKALDKGTEDYATRSKTIDVIKPYIEDVKVRQSLLRVMKEDKNPAIRMKALTVLSKAARTGEVKDAILDRLMNDEDEAVRFKSVEILEEIVDAQIASTLLRIKNADKSELVRKRAETVYKNHMEKAKYL